MTTSERLREVTKLFSPHETDERVVLERKAAGELDSLTKERDRLRDLLRVITDYSGAGKPCPTWLHMEAESALKGETKE